MREVKSLDNLNDSVKEISMERVMYKKPFPAFKVVFKRDGEATYEGKYFVDKIGKYVGTIDDVDFKMLSSLMERLGFTGLMEKYMIDGRDQPSVVTTLIYEGGTKTVGDYGEAGPVEIWAIEKVIDTLVEDIYWEKEE
jgi:sporulation protein YlmC with PRC-barrel domain